MALTVIVLILTGRKISKCGEFDFTPLFILPFGILLSWFEALLCFALEGMLFSAFVTAISTHCNRFVLFLQVEF